MKIRNLLQDDNNNEEFYEKNMDEFYEGQTINECLQKMVVDRWICGEEPELNFKDDIEYLERTEFITWEEVDE